MSIESEFREAYEAQVKGDLARAERGYRALVRSKPYPANHNLGLVCASMNKVRAAESAFRAALEAEPGAAGSCYALGLLLLSEGRYEEGWPLYQSRRDIPGVAAPIPHLPFPEWDGQSLAGKTLLVLAEQGLGDNLMFARFFAPLRAAGARVLYACPAPLRGLMDLAGVETLSEAEAAQSPSGDYWALLSALPLHLKTTLDALAPPLAIAVSGPQSGGGVGVVPQGNPAHKDDRQRSLFGRDAARLLALGRDLRPEATGAKDFLDTARIVAGLDVVISVDTSVAHLAASMGKPTLVLLPARETDWRWLRERADSPWYPSARLYRQRVTGDWVPVFRRLDSALAEMGLR
jgi:hypothetical protein